MFSFSSKRHATVLLAVAVPLLLTYLGLQNRNYSYDSCGYSESIKYGIDLFHPHHLIYNFVFHHIYLFIHRTAGFDAMAIASAFNGIAMAANALLVGLLIYKITDSIHLSWSSSVFYGLCYAPLFVATSVEVYPWNILLNLLGFALLLGRSPPGVARVVLIGCLAGVAALFHQTAVFAALALLVLLLRLRVRPWLVLLRNGCHAFVRHPLRVGGGAAREGDTARPAGVLVGICSQPGISCRRMGSWVVAAAPSDGIFGDRIDVFTAPP